MSALETPYPKSHYQWSTHVLGLLSWLFKEFCSAADVPVICCELSVGSHLSWMTKNLWIWMVIIHFRVLVYIHIQYTYIHTVLPCTPLLWEMRFWKFIFAMAEEELS